MSDEQVIALGVTDASGRERWTARLVVLAARVLARQPPRRIERTLVRCARSARPASYAEASRARAIVVGVSLACTGPRGCLRRSIATALLCRSRGTFPTWCVGARVVPPFGAHAWVVADGRDVDEPYPAGYHRVLLQVRPPDVASGGR